MPFGIGIWELLILLLVLLLVFGPKRLPEMGRQLGKGMREFKGSVTGMTDAMDLSDEPAPAAQPARPAQSAPALPPAQPTPAPADADERETVDVVGGTRIRRRLVLPVPAPPDQPVRRAAATRPADQPSSAARSFLESDCSSFQPIAPFSITSGRNSQRVSP